MRRALLLFALLGCSDPPDDVCSTSEDCTPSRPLCVNGACISPDAGETDAGEASDAGGDVGEGCEPTSELDLCNGLDDDCDASTPDGVNDPERETFCADLGGEAVCFEGRLRCLRDEVCDNGADDDLDGAIDEGCGARELCDNGVDDDMDGNVDEGCADEICGNDMDDDMDGMIDEGCEGPCPPHPVDPHPTRMPPCSAGTVMCMQMCGDPSCLEACLEAGGTQCRPCYFRQLSVCTRRVCRSEWDCWAECTGCEVADGCGASTCMMEGAVVNNCINDAVAAGETCEEINACFEMP